MTSTVKIPEWWIETTLWEIVDVKSWSTPSTKEESYWDWNISWITPKDLSTYNKRFIDRWEKNITELWLKKSSAQLLPKNTVLFSSRAPIWYVAIANKELTTNQGFKNLICDENNSHFMFFYYWLKCKKDFIEWLASWSTFSEISWTWMKNLPIILPPLPEQKAIAGVLSAFDDKIELLRAENQTLEEMGQTLFKERFPHNNPCIRFWDFVEVKRWGSPRPIQDFISDTWYRRLKISDATAETSPYIFNIKERIKESWLKKTVHLDAWSLILSNSATPWIPKILAVDSCIHDWWLYFPKSKFSKEFLYLLFLTIRPDLLAQWSWSVFTNLKTDILKWYLLPDYWKESLDNFQKIIEPIFQKIKTNSEEIESLSKTRDQLLPKLMSWEVRVEF